MLLFFLFPGCDGKKDIPEKASIDTKRDETPAVVIQMENDSTNVTKAILYDDSEYVRKNDFPPRENHKLLVLKNRLFIIGGMSEIKDNDEKIDIIFNDVWWSSDGFKWEKLADDIVNPPRTYFSAIVYNNKMWIFGGQAEDNTMLNDVWSSDDGVVWKKEKTESPYRACAGAFIINSNKQLYLLGGDTEDFGKSMNVWESDDAINWKGIKSEVSDYHSTQGVAELNSWYFVFSEPETIFKSKDLINWEKDDFPEQINHRYGFCILQKQDTVFLMGGQSGASDIWDGTFNDVWSTNDGVNWKLLTKPPIEGGFFLKDNYESFYSRSNFDAVVFDGKIIIAGGRQADKYLNGVWSSVDGIVWEPIKGTMEYDFKIKE